MSSRLRSTIRVRVSALICQRRVRDLAGAARGWLRAQRARARSHTTAGVALQLDDRLRLAAIDLACDAQLVALHAQLDAIADRAAAQPVGEARRDFLAVGVVGEQHGARRKLAAKLRQRIQADLGLIVGQLRLIGDDDRSAKRATSAASESAAARREQ